ncbi:MAG TPA: hypothetical protein VEO54_08190 [Thermoanaerobaculia bacterium]|nr:hypothetical protein [Thermoanaerobaculia bacterium]
MTRALLALALFASFSTYAQEYIPNRIKYSDTGLKPATGRAGDIDVAARALLGADGVTDVEVTTGTFDGGAPTGTLQRVQVKIGLDQEDPITRTFDVSGTFASVRLDGVALAPRETIRIQVSAQSTDAMRTGVVTLSETVKRRPDLRAQRVDSPPNGVEGHPVNVYLSVYESNGDVGARADCVLRVNGTEVDRATGIWVDANSGVTCAMAHVFQTAGVYPMTLSVENVSPGDWNLANNAQTVNVNVRPASQVVAGGSYVATATDRTTETHWSSRSDESAPNWENEDSLNVDRSNNTRLDAAFPAELDFATMQISLSEESEGEMLAFMQSTRYLEPENYPYVNCVQLNFGRTHSYFACVNNGVTTVHYARGSRATRYYSRWWGMYTRDWLGDKYTFDYEMHMNRPARQYGATVSMQLIAADADEIWQVEPYLVMQPWSNPPTSTHGCYTAWFGNVCWTQTTKQYGANGRDEM